jgi:hypothetical protein
MQYPMIMRITFGSSSISCSTRGLFHVSRWRTIDGRLNTQQNKRSQRKQSTTLFWYAPARAPNRTSRHSGGWKVFRGGSSTVMSNADQKGSVGRESQLSDSVTRPPTLRPKFAGRLRMPSCDEKRRVGVTTVHIRQVDTCIE